MRTFAESLVPVGGDLHGHLFENATTGLTRDLFWSVEIRFQALEFAGEAWTVGIQAEWLTWPIRRWTDLSGCQLESVAKPELVEASIYLADHQWITLESLALRRLEGRRFLLTLAASLELEDPTGARHGPTSREFAVPIDFLGVYVLPESLSTKPATVADVSRELDAFLSVQDFRPPTWDRFRFTFQPKPEA